MTWTNPNEEEAFREFAVRIGRPEEPYRKSFREIWIELAGQRGGGFDDALTLLVQWYQDEHKGERHTLEATIVQEAVCSPLSVIETYRRPRAWVIFLCWSHHGQPFSPG